MKIRIITPSIRHDWHDSTMAVYKPHASPGTELSLAFLDHGPESIESDYDVILAGPDTLAQVRRAEADGMDAVIINCMFDPMLFAAREMVDIPVVGPAQAAMSLAATLADRFSMVTILDRDVALIHNQWRLYDLMGRGASVRSVNVPVVELHEDSKSLCMAMIQQSILAITEDGAQAIVFGCTGLGGMADPVRKGLEAAGHFGVPVIDPTGVALKWAELLVGLGLSHSKQTFPAPTHKKITGYEKLGLT
jgi:allantoin racemase